MENFFFRHSTHFNDMFHNFEEFYNSKALSDVVIAVEGKTIHAHRIVLSAGSDYFRRILTAIRDPNHTPVLVISDISAADMEAMLEFLYRGQIVVTRDKVDDLRHAAYKLRIKGFENFLRKPFPSTTISGHGLGMPMGNQFRMNGGSHAVSMLSNHQYEPPLQHHQPQQQHHLNNGGNKRALASMGSNESDHKRKRSNKQQHDNAAKGGHIFDPARLSKEALLQINRLQHEIARQRQSIVPNGYPHSSPSGMQRMNAQLEQLMMKHNSIDSIRPPQHPSPQESPANLTRHKPDHSAISITPMKNESNEIGGDSCDEQEENQRNENTENGVVEQAQDLSKDASNMNRSNGHHQERVDADDCESDDDKEVNYTYEMDPNALNCWDTYADNDNENVPENPEGGDSDGYDEDEDYFENVGNENQAKMEMLNQLHIKRSHGLNKLNQCNICGKTYAWKSGLYKHKRHVHNISGKTLNQVNDNVMDGESLSPPTTPTSLMQPSMMMAQSLLPPMPMPPLVSPSVLQANLPGVSLMAEQPPAIKA